MASMIKLLLVDDEELILKGLAILLGAYEDIEVVATAKSGREAADLCNHYAVDVVVMDIRMPNSNGIEGTRLIKAAHPSIKVLILTTFQDIEYIASTMHEGASGYLLKDSSPEEIYESIRMVFRHHVVLDEAISEWVVKQSAALQRVFDRDKYGLSEKEVEIVKLIASGLNNEEIAKKLYLSLGTIKNNVTVILNKLCLRDRTQLAIFAFKEGMVE